MVVDTSELALHDGAKCAENDFLILATFAHGATILRYVK